MGNTSLNGKVKVLGGKSIRKPLGSKADWIGLVSSKLNGENCTNFEVA